MKTAIYNAPAEIVSDGKKIQFKMSASPKAFSILADGIYADKISAVIRELSTNAWDSHVQAGNKNPFDVHLPTSFNQNFFIRDYGVGLSEEEIESIYTTFFDSNKTDSNDYTGGLGLGSKTPFCYNTKSFVVTSIKNGLKLTYSAYIDEYGFPSLVKMSECNSDEPTGVKVEFPVRSIDSSDFKRNAQNIYRWFDTKPNFVGSSVNIEDPRESLFLDVKTNYIQKIYNSKHSGVVMGNIFYPYHFFSGTSFVVYCDIGSLDIETSREGLAFTEKTKRRIDFIKKTIENEYRKIIENRIESCKNYWEAMREAQKIRTSFRGFDLSFIKYKGEDLKASFCIEQSIKNIDIVRYGYSNRSLDLIKLAWGDGTDSEFIGFPGGVYVNDSSYSSKRVKDASKYSGKSLLIPDQETADKFCDWLNFPKTSLIKTSTLPLNIKKKTAFNSNNKKGTITKIEKNHRKSYCFKTVDIDFSTYDFTDHYYVLSSHYNILTPNGEQHPNYIKQIENDLNSIGIKVNILSTTKTQEKIISQNCESLWTFLEKLSKDSVFLKKLETSDVYYGSFSYSERRYADFLSDFEEAKENGHIINEFVSAKQIAVTAKCLIEIIMYMRLTHGFTREKYNASEKLKDIMNKYPLLDTADKNLFPHYQKYIKLVDKGVF